MLLYNVCISLDGNSTKQASQISTRMCSVFFWQRISSRNYWQALGDHYSLPEFRYLPLFAPYLEQPEYAEKDMTKIVMVRFCLYLYPSSASRLLPVFLPSVGTPDKPLSKPPFLSCFQSMLILFLHYSYLSLDIFLCLPILRPHWVALNL